MKFPKAKQLSRVAISACLVLLVALAGCSGKPPAKPFFDGAITYDGRSINDPTFEQIESAFKGLPWEVSEQAPIFTINGSGTASLRITRWCDRDKDGLETFEKSNRIVVVWKKPPEPAQQCQLENAEQGLKLVLAFAQKEDISGMLDWFEFWGLWQKRETLWGLLKSENEVHDIQATFEIKTCLTDLGPI